MENIMNNGENQLNIYVKGREALLIKEFKERCASKKLKVNYVILELIKQYLCQEVYVASDEDDDTVATNFINLFRKLCPKLMIPPRSNDLVTRIVRAVRQRPPEWWENVWREAGEIPWKPEVWQPNFNWLLDLDNCFKIISGQFNRLKEDKERAKRDEERRIKREAERLEKERLKKEEAERKAEQKAKDLAEKQRIKQEEAERKAKEKEEKERLKHPELAEAKKKEEERERLEKERQERLEKSKHEPYWADVAYVDDKGYERPGWVYPDSWTDEQIVEWELEHE